MLPQTLQRLVVFHHVVFFLFTSIVAFGQCNTTLSKLLPEATINNDDRFGSAIDANNEYMVVAAESSDTTGILYGGAAFVYQKTVAGWAFRAALTPSDPNEYDFFGNRVAIDASGSTIVVINRNYDHGGIYIFEKPLSGWESMHESYNIKFPEYLEFNSALDISDDGSTIAVSNPMSDNGLIYLLRKPPGGWTNTMTPETLVSRMKPYGTEWTGHDLLIQGDYIYASTENGDPTGIVVYKRDTNDQYQRIALLKVSLPFGSVGYFARHLSVYGNTVVATGLVYLAGELSQRFFIFNKDGEWTDMEETLQFQLPGLESYKFPYPIEFVSSKEIIVNVLTKDSDHYTGRVVEISTTDGTWTDIVTKTLFLDEDLPIVSEFANGTAWNGSDFVMATTRKYLNGPFRNSVLSLTRSGGPWGSQQQVVLPRVSSSGVFFGTSIVKTKDAMFAGAPYDGSTGPETGAVYVYHHSGGDFVKMHTINPSPRKQRPDGTKDMAFGTSISVHGDDMAIGAPSFRYDENKYGKIFLFRRTSPDWTTTELYDSVQAPKDLDLNHVGTEVVMNDHVLFASAYNNFAGEHTNAVIIFEKINGKWAYKQLIKLGKPLDKTWSSVKFSLNGDQLAIGEYFTIGGGVSIINKNITSATWEITAFIPGDIFSGFGSSVKLLDNHLFVGAPGVSYNNIYRSGAVAIFSKLPGQPWHSNMQASALIGAKNPVEGAFFGSSLDVVGNTLAVGAPGMFLTFDSQVRTIPGNTYIIQAHDYYWTSTTEYLNLQGDRYASNERDHFGSEVVLDEDYFYIGARSEHTSTGKFSGAVYYIPTPPVIFLEPPVCAGAEPLVLKGYPYGGVWSGEGVNTGGIFDPVLAGVGVKTLTYLSPNCNYPGTVQIEVKGPLPVEQLSPPEISLCSEGHTTLQLNLIDGATYAWYYKPESQSSFVFFREGGPSIDVSNPGDYKAIVSMSCATESSVFRIAYESFPLNVGPQPVVCSEDETVSLVASVTGGKWEGSGVSSGSFSPAGLSNGWNKLVYRIVSPQGCEVALQDSIKVNIVGPITINQRENNFCETGSANVEATASEDDLDYTWYYRETLNSEAIKINAELSDLITAYKEGYYQAVASNGECSNASNLLEVGLSGALLYELFPAQNSKTTVCNSDEFKIEVRTQSGTEYTWLYKSSEVEDYQPVNVPGANEIFVKQSGFYKVQGQYGFCSFDSEPVALEFARDEIFVPNVFTPNGDEKNPSFKVVTSAPISLFTIYNRHGQQIYNDTSGEWFGDDAPSGVYYWRLLYIGCEDVKELKGWVQLLR